MNNNILTSYEDDNKRITVHYDMCADAPNRKEEFLGKMLYMAMTAATFMTCAIMRI